MNILLISLNNNIVNRIFQYLQANNHYIYILSNEAKLNVKYSLKLKGLFIVDENATDRVIIETINTKDKKYCFDKIMATDLNSTLFLARNKEIFKEKIPATAPESTIISLHNK